MAFAGLREAVPNLFQMDLDSGRITDLTNDDFAEYAPAYSPDGKFLVYVTRVSGNDKLFKLDLATKQKTQLTFGTHDDTGAHFIDDHTVVFASTASDPNKPVDPEVARNGQIFNVWTLDLQTGELRRYTDTATAALSPVVLHDGSLTRFAFVTYFKGDFGIHAIEEKQADLTVASSDFGAPGPIIDFQAPLQHTLVKANERKKGTFEKMFLDGRPPINVGVTNNGDIFGGTALTFSDVLGDQQFNFYASSIAQYRTLLFSYANLSRRLQWATQAYSQTLFFYGLGAGYLYDPSYAYISRDQAQATQTARGGSIFGIYPINRYARIELSAGLLQFKQQYNDLGLQAQAQQYQQQAYGGQLFANGTFMPLGAAYVRETTIFREYGPLSGDTMRLSYEYAPRMGGLLSRQTADVDARYYMRLGTNGVLALRARGYKSWGDLPDYTFFGGNSSMRGYDYLQFLGNDAFFGNAELRFPLIEAMATPIGVLGGIRGVFFFDIGGAGFAGQAFNPFTRSSQTVTPIVNYVPNFDTNTYDPVYGNPVTISGFRLKDARASYGIGLETFALGFPIHFDWAWRTTFNKAWEDYFNALNGGSSAFRKARFQVWIGYDF